MISSSRIEALFKEGFSFPSVLILTHYNMVDSRTLISDLVDAGNDAASNLFLVDIFTEGSISTDSFRFRATDVTIPSIGNNTVSLPYQNNEYVFVAPGTALTRRVLITYRIDDNYNVLRSLHALLNMTDTKGSGFEHNSKTKQLTVRVTVLKNLEREALIYEFTGCYLEAINDLTYSYENAGNLKTGNLKIVFSDMSIKDAPGSGD